jgi:hypothetical protein
MSPRRALAEWAFGAIALGLVSGCSVPAFTGHRMDARAETSDLGADANDVGADTDTIDASDAVSAPEVADAIATDIAPDADAAAPVDADAGVPVDVTPALRFTFVSGAVVGRAGATSIRGHFVWHGTITGRSTDGRTRIHGQFR